MMSEAEFFDEVTDIVKAERKKRGISQLSLAMILGHQSPSYVARIELRQSKANYSLHHLFLIAEEFGLDIRHLLPSTSSFTEV